MLSIPVLAAVLALGAGEPPLPALERSADQELRDLYGIFELEIGNQRTGNIYAGMGNHLEVDGWLTTTSSWR